MKTFHKQQTFFALVFISAAFCLIAIQPAPAAEPEYQGKALSEWLVALQANLSDEHAREAILRVGTNGLPTLLGLVSVVERNRRNVARRITSKDIQKSLRDSDPDFREAVRGMAVDGFGILGTNAEPAIPQLTKLLHGDPDCQLDVTRALIRVGPKGFAVLTNILNDPRDGTRNTLIWVIGQEGGGDTRAVTELLIQALKDPNWSNRGNAAKFLKGRDAELAVPALISLLDSSKDDYYTVKGVAEALSSYGPAASNAVPKLFSLYTNAVTDTNRVEWSIPLMWALKAIDKEAAGKAEEFLVNSGPLNYARIAYTRTRLTNGLELIAGGIVHTEIPTKTNRCLSKAELLDPKTGKWKETGEMHTARFDHRATLLPDGKVLVVGGSDIHNNGVSSEELYDPATGTWTVVTNK